ncbi:pyridoxamine 5'-phosphate oxidase [Blastococcus sp. CT_GayMR20]|uniref:pyridoxamine 5'-phosphate oxidase family protein n=1 Tax=Blastococcus sp. CT_GayMR20 TaxID=2559609 RepID=UPI0010742D12|nr:pyridoxamine 5'-phosphate oxidase family protein [Blastococcus sp. CT_GayMR20]TFV92580.1 pyridoxamine 5'-phosphate oxidase [Blastococcus sp. CT_GayMR20]TFV92633.1 pyridoxamine 5'-phosphate oxidase [Blastococcus sp. CT_GayMR20]
MASFADLESREPEFAARVRAAFDAHEHKFLATLRADGSPRISGITMQFVGGEPWLAGMPESVKFADLRRDPRFALHSGSSEPDAFSGDAKLSGRAAEVTGSAERSGYAKAAGVPKAMMHFVLFRVALEQVVLVALNDEKTALVISSWRPGRGLTRTLRT